MVSCDVSFGAFVKDYLGRKLQTLIGFILMCCFEIYT